MTIILVVVALLMLAGLVGSVVPFLPATPLIFAGALLYAVAWGIDGWAQALVLGVILLTAVGLMIAVSPRRRT